MDLSLISNTAELEALARGVRADVVTMACRSRSAHTSPSLSCVDILTSLYFAVMNVDPAAPGREDRDRLVFSKGHGAMALYAVLARKGFFPRGTLETYCAEGSALWEHPASKGIPGVEFAAGSLGHGLALAAGTALALKKKGNPARVFVLVGDGECDEGSVYEAAAFAGGHCLDNLTLVMDRNGMQACGVCGEISGCIDYATLFTSLNWSTAGADGHSFPSLLGALSAPGGGRPLAVIANTVKGKGVSYMENDLEWHYRPPSENDLKIALGELGTE